MRRLLMIAGLVVLFLGLLRLAGAAGAEPAPRHVAQARLLRLG